jgi:hypothetical protein
LRRLHYLLHLGKFLAGGKKSSFFVITTFWARSKSSTLPAFWVMHSVRSGANSHWICTIRREKNRDGEQRQGCQTFPTTLPM